MLGRLIALTVMATLAAACAPAAPQPAPTLSSVATTAPTAAPTRPAPTVAPTAAPTSAPAASPAAPPTLAPAVAAPTSAVAPTAAPTVAPANAPTPAPTAPAGGPPAVRIVEPPGNEASAWTYEPNSVSVKVGDAITWANTGNQPHTVTSSAGGFDSGLIQPGKTWTFTATKVGTFNYHCTLHPWMKGTLTLS